MLDRVPLLCEQFYLKLFLAKHLTLASAWQGVRHSFTAVLKILSLRVIPPVFVTCQARAMSLQESEQY